MTRTTPVLKKTEVLQHTRLFDLVNEQYSHDGREYERVVIKHPGAVVILPRGQDGRFLMVRQYRCAIKKWIVEFPAGTLEKGEDALVCAKRELSEEAACEAADWTPLGELYPTPGICDEKQYLFFASGLSRKEGQLDEDEIIELESHSLEEVEAAIRDGTICDAKSLSIFTRARLRGLI